jgi:hypothetical protein
MLLQRKPAGLLELMRNVNRGQGAESRGRINADHRLEAPNRRLKFDLDL